MSESFKPLEVLNASAGSGKTYSLVQKYLKLILSHVSDKSFSHVMAMTFTNKAAFEMKQRILDALDEISSVEIEVGKRREKGIMKIAQLSKELNVAEKEIIEVFALAYMRGMNIDNSILIFEEAQNATPNQMKLLLTRIGFNSKFFISGDLEQTDRYKDKTHSGLWDAMKRFSDLDNIGTHEFKDTDVVRNPLITKILKRYED